MMEESMSETRVKGLVISGRFQEPLNFSMLKKIIHFEGQ